MAYDFPASPTTGDTFEDPTSGTKYIWSGTVWDLAAGGDLSDYVLKIGDTMTGELSFADNFGASFHGGSRIWKASGSAQLRIEAATQLDVKVATENKLQIRTDGLFIPTVANDKNGYFVGDRWHGMYFHGGNTTVFTEYHDRFEWRRQTSGAAGGGDLRMSLYAGQLKLYSNNHFIVGSDNYGIGFYGGGFLYKKAGEGLILRQSSGDYRSAIQNNAGTWLGWISYQASATLSVEELIEERVTPLLDMINELKAELAALKAKVK